MAKKKVKLADQPKIREVEVYACPNCKTIHRGTGVMVVCGKCGWYDQKQYLVFNGNLINAKKALKKVNPEMYKELEKNEKRIRLGKKPLPTKFATNLDQAYESLHPTKHPIQQEQQTVDREIPSEQSSSKPIRKTNKTNLQKSEK